MSPFDRIILKIPSVGGIAGVIAIIIAGTICARYFMHGAEEIPQVLTYSLTTIIGFYFGASVSKGNGTAAPNSKTIDVSLADAEE